jgi:hypothetical protein
MVKTRSVDIFGSLRLLGLKFRGELVNVALNDLLEDLYEFLGLPGNMRVASSDATELVNVHCQNDSS